MARLPPWLTLFVFVIPALVLFPFKLLGLWLLGTGHPLLGVATFFAAKTAGVGCAAFLFEIATAGLEFGWPDAMTVLERARMVVQQRRDVPGVNARADAFEIAFHRAALSVLIGLQRSEAVEGYLLRIADRVALLHEGRIAWTGPPDAMAAADSRPLRAFLDPLRQAT